MKDVDFGEHTVDDLDVVLELAQLLRPLSPDLQPNLQLLLHLPRFMSGGAVATTTTRNTNHAYVIGATLAAERRPP
jgi:hypothetical protein